MRWALSIITLLVVFTSPAFGAAGHRSPYLSIGAARAAIGRLEHKYAAVHPELRTAPRIYGCSRRSRASVSCDREHESRIDGERAECVQRVTVSLTDRHTLHLRFGASSCRSLEPRAPTAPAPVAVPPATVVPPPTAPPPPPVNEGPPAPVAMCEGGPEDVGSYCHAEDARFCSEHQCIGSFTTEPGTVAECYDGTYSHAGHISGACSHHGGVRRD
jgi:hypothetical protein